MLKGVPAFITADVLWIMASMGHGDELAIVDRNFSGFSRGGPNHERKASDPGGCRCTDRSSRDPSNDALGRVR